MFSQKKEFLQTREYSRNREIVKEKAMKSVRYIDLAIQKGGHKNDFGLSKKLGWSSGAISMYRSGKRIMDDEACLALALELDINPLEIIGAACIDRAEKSGQKSLWEVFMSRTAAAAATVLVASGVNLFLTHGNAEAHTYGPYGEGRGQTIYIMSNRRRKAWARLRAKLAGIKGVSMPRALEAAAR